MCDSHRHHETTTTAAAPAGAGVTFHVSDMTCGHCAAVIRSALEESLPGATIEIDMTKATVTVSGAQTKAEEDIRTAASQPVEIAHERERRQHSAAACPHPEGRGEQDVRAGTTTTHTTRN